MMLTQLSTVKNRLGITDTTDDTLLTNFIKSASARFESECHRLFERTVNAVEEFSGDVTDIRVARYPVESVSQFHLKDNETDGWQLQSNADYLIRRGCVIWLGSALGTQYQHAKVTYTGGYVLPPNTPGAGQTALPDDLEQTCVEQVAYWYQNRHRLGLLSVPADGRTFYQLAKIDLLPQVEAVLKKYERWEN
jgi:gp6-like head-tail connector protein